jgi:hypothetical protein
MRQVLSWKFIALGWCVSIPMSVLAYEVATHEDISEQAVLQSKLKDVLPSIGLKTTNDLLTDIDTTRTIAEWIVVGANHEDDTLSTNFARYRNHFYDPQHGGQGYSFGALTGEPSPDWALEDMRTFLTQTYSLKDARQYFYDALTLDNKDNRQQWMARTFYTLGHLIHHLQDMAQPQHTRNDSHGGGVFGAPSLYEMWTDRDTVRSTLPYTGYPAVTFDTARRFWIDQGRGIAEFTNTNFVSAGTNFSGTSSAIGPNPNYLKPDGTGATVSTRQITDPDLLGPNQPLSGEIDFIGTPVTDNYRSAASGFNPRTSSYSLFDADLAQAGQQKTFSLNRFNFNEHQKFLIPRAVAYSAGLIDYFFRGNLGAEDVQFSASGTSLRVRNAIDTAKTPEWRNEMLRKGGELVIAFEYKLGTQVYMGKSDVVLLQEDIAPGHKSATVYSFTYSIPLTATAIKERLVFKGIIGQEEGAVAYGPITPSGGFIFQSNYTPADGIAGTRHIYKRNGQWKLDDKSGFEAGNIDWKGWYKNGYPTKALTWHGPATRYFNGDGTFQNKIYQNGELFSVSPYPVVGAALFLDGNGDEWIVAICADGKSDVALRRPNKKSTSSAFYDSSVAPEGWQEIGRFPAPAKAHWPAAPWFFNSSGTEAQTIRIWDYKDDENFNHLYKVRITAGATAIFEDLGVTPPGQAQGTSTHPPTVQQSSGEDNYPRYLPCWGTAEDCPQHCSSYYTPGMGSGTYSSHEDASSNSVSSASAVVAVDYVVDAPVYATVKRNESRTSTSKDHLDGGGWSLAYYIGNTPFICEGSSSSKSVMSHVISKNSDITLEVPGMDTLVLHRYREHTEYKWELNTDTTYHNMEQTRVESSFEEYTIAISAIDSEVHYLDMRNGFVIFHGRHATYTGDGIKSPSAAYATNPVFAKTEDREFEVRAAGKGLNEVLRMAKVSRQDETGKSFSYRGVPLFVVLPQLSYYSEYNESYPLSVGFETWNRSPMINPRSCLGLYESYNPYIKVSGAAARDGDLFFSSDFDLCGERKRINFLTGGNPASITGITATDATFFPIWIE